MMFKKNLVAAIKVNGKVLRESSERVELPFGSEYSILLKNLDTVRMMVNIQIDGKDVTDGQIVLYPGQESEIERSIVNGNLSRGHRFKFIERTEAIEEHRGIKAEDGLVRIEFKREKVIEIPKITYHYHYDYHPYLRSCFGQSASLSSHSSNIGGSSVRSFQNNQNTASAIGACAVNTAGITAEGSVSNQSFTRVSSFETEGSEALVLQLIGRKAGKTVKVAKTVQVKLTCQTCGKQSKSSASFCRSCGTNLEKL